MLAGSFCNGGREERGEKLHQHSSQVSNTAGQQVSSTPQQLGQQVSSTPQQVSKSAAQQLSRPACHLQAGRPPLQQSRQATITTEQAGVRVLYTTDSL